MLPTNHRREDTSAWQPVQVRKVRRKDSSQRRRKSRHSDGAEEANLEASGAVIVKRRRLRRTAHGSDDARGPGDRQESGATTRRRRRTKHSRSAQSLGTNSGAPAAARGVASESEQESDDYSSGSRKDGDGGSVDGSDEQSPSAGQRVKEKALSVIVANLSGPMGPDPLGEVALAHLCGPDLKFQPVTNAQYRLCVCVAAAATVVWGLLFCCAFFLTTGPRDVIPTGPEWETLPLPTTPPVNASLPAGSATNQSDVGDSGGEDPDGTSARNIMCWFDVAAHHYRCECVGCRWLCRFRMIWRFRPIRCVWFADTWHCYEQSLLARQFTTVTCPAHTLCSQVEDRCAVTVHAGGLVRALCLIMCVAFAVITLLIFFGVGWTRKGTKIS